MTARQVYEAALIELNKNEAPSMLLEDFNYFFNKAIYQYINKKYNIYDVNQQTTDDIRVLKATAVLKPKPKSESNAYGEPEENNEMGSLFGGVKEFELPMDYLHLLNCVCNFKVSGTFKCYDKDENVQFGARRLTADMWSQIINNFYMRPSYRRPYYYIHNVNNNVNLPTNTTTDCELPDKIIIGDKETSLIEKPAINRYGNAEPVRMEIRYGKDDSVFDLTKIYIDYIKTPQHIRLTQAQLDQTVDTSQILEFPDYVCQEIINELVKLMMENASDPRLQTNIPINQTIASPVQQGQK